MFKDIHDDQMVQSIMHLFSEKLLEGTLTDEDIIDRIPEVLNRYLNSYTLKCVDKPFEARKVASIKDQDIREIQRKIRRHISIDQSLTGILDPRYFYLDPIAKRKILNRTIAEDRVTKWNQVYIDVYQPQLNRIKGCSITIGGSLMDKLPLLENIYVANLVDLGNEIQDVLATEYSPAVGAYQINRPDIKGTQLLMSTGLGANRDVPTLTKATTEKKKDYLDNQRPYGIDILWGLEKRPYAHTIGEHPLARWRNRFTGRILHTLSENIEPTYKLFPIPNEPLMYNIEEVDHILTQIKEMRVTA